MAALEFSLRHSDNKDKTKEKESDFKITFIDDNTVHLCNADGRELAFEFPTRGTTNDDYDKFVQQMHDEHSPLPLESAITMSISKPLIDPMHEPSTTRKNSSGQPSSFKDLAEKLQIDAEELKGMYLFARHQLYQRFKNRLRRTASNI